MGANPQLRSPTNNIKIYAPFWLSPAYFKFQKQPRKRHYLKTKIIKQSNYNNIYPVDRIYADPTYPLPFGGRKVVSDKQSNKCNQNYDSTCSKQYFNVSASGFTICYHVVSNFKCKMTMDRWVMKVNYCQPSTFTCVKQDLRILA